MAKNFRKASNSPMRLPMKQIEFKLVTPDQKLLYGSKRFARKYKNCNGTATVNNSLKGSMEKNINLLITNSQPLKISENTIKSTRMSPAMLKEKAIPHTELNKDYEENSLKNEIKYVIDSVFQNAPLKRKLKNRALSDKAPKYLAAARCPKYYDNNYSIYQKTRILLNKSEASCKKSDLS